MVGADIVLGLLQVDPGLAAVGRVDLGHKRRGDLDVADMDVDVKKFEDMFVELMSK